MKLYKMDVKSEQCWWKMALKCGWIELVEILNVLHRYKVKEKYKE